MAGYVYTHRHFRWEGLKPITVFAETQDYDEARDLFIRTKIWNLDGLAGPSASSILLTRKEVTAEFENRNQVPKCCLTMRCSGRRWSRTLGLAQAHTSGDLMFDHVKFGVSDYPASKAFFLKALEPLGVAVVSEGPPTYGVELSPKGKASLCLYQTEAKPAHLHLAFTAENRQQVEAFYRAALEAGGNDNGAPGLRPHYDANYYAAFVIGPDGHNIEVVCHEPEA